MSPTPVKILLTGTPGCGKTTAIIKIAENLKDIKISGFYTKQIRQNDKRTGFSFKILDGAEGILAHINVKGSPKVSKYGVNVSAFEKSAIPVLDTEQTDAELFIIDEIGKMECLSEKFVTAVRRLFASDKSVLATVAKKGTGLISDVKHYPSTRLFNLTANNRDKTIAEIVQILSSLK